MKTYLLGILLALACLNTFAGETEEKHYFDRVILKTGVTLSCDVFYVNTGSSLSVYYARADKLGGGELKSNDISEIYFDEGNPELPWSSLSWTVAKNTFDRKPVKVNSFKNGVLYFTNAEGKEETYEKSFTLSCFGAKNINVRLKIDKIQQEKGSSICVPYSYYMLTSQHIPVMKEEFAVAMGSDWGEMARKGTNAVQRKKIEDYFAKKGYTFEKRVVPSSTWQAFSYLADAVKMIDEGQGSEWYCFFQRGGSHSFVVYGYEDGGIEFAVANWIFSMKDWGTGGAVSYWDLILGRGFVDTFNSGFSEERAKSNWMMVSKVFYKGHPIKAKSTDNFKKSYSNGYIPKGNGKAEFELFWMHKISKEVFDTNGLAPKSEKCKRLEELKRSPAATEAVRKLSCGLIDLDGYRKELENVRDGVNNEPVPDMSPENGFDHYKD